MQREGRLQKLGHGLYYAPRPTRFGPAPPTEDAILDALLDGTPYVITGAARWNALGLGSTAMHVHPWVYNLKRTGVVQLAGRSFDLRRTAFPHPPSPEWFVVDLLRHSDSAGANVEDLLEHLSCAMRRGSFDPQQLHQMAEQFGTWRERSFLRSLLENP